MRHYGFRATVQVHGVAAQELQTTKEGNRITCYIASESRKRFVVTYESVNDSDRRPFEVNGLIYIDGDEKPATEGYLGGVIRKRWRKGLLNSAQSVVPFTFADVTTTDDDAVAVPHRDCSSLGQIVVRLHHGTRAGRIEHKTFGPVRLVQQLHEQSVKGTKVSHATITGRPMRVCPQRRRAFHYQDTKNPYVEFVFLYRSREVLLAMGAYGGDDDELECQEPMRAGYIPLVAAPREVPVQENAQAGPSRHRAPDSRFDRQFGPPPSSSGGSIRGSVGPSRSVTVGRSPSPVQSKLRMNQQSINIGSGWNEVKADPRRPVSRNRALEVDLTEDDDDLAPTNVKTEATLADDLREIAALEAKLEMMRQKARDRRARSPRAAQKQAACRTKTERRSPPVARPKGKARAAPVEVVDLTGDDD